MEFIVRQAPGLLGMEGAKAGDGQFHALLDMHAVQPDEISASDDTACSNCLSHEINLCLKVREKAQSPDGLFDFSALPSTVHIIPSRKMICHPKDWSEYVPIICQGWASSSIALLDGKRQILSIALPGELISVVNLLGDDSERAVQALTDVTCRRFKRAELKAFIFDQPDLLAMLMGLFIQERKELDQLALDLGRRMAEGRIARLILSLSKRLARRGMMQDCVIDFPLRQNHIADATGLTPVHVSKVMVKFQRANLIEVSGRKLKILDEAQLCDIAR